MTQRKPCVRAGGVPCRTTVPPPCASNIKAADIRSCPPMFSAPSTALENLPESAQPWYHYNAERDEREAREESRREMVDVLAAIMAARLSRRQQDALQLYYVHGLTEVQVAMLLHISQPTVSQHLTGKRRAGRKVGGALAKLRKGIRRAIAEKDPSARRRQIVAVLNGLLDGPPTRRHGARLFDSLRSASSPPAEK